MRGRVNNRRATSHNKSPGQGQNLMNEFTKTRLTSLVKRLLAVRAFQVPEPKAYPEPGSQIIHDFDEYNQKMEITRQIAHYNDWVEHKRFQKNKLKLSLEKAILKNLPSYYWFVIVLAAEQHYAVGISTNNRPGSSAVLHIEKYYPGRENSHLHRLKHVNYSG